VSNQKHCEDIQKENYSLFVFKALALETIPLVCYKSVTLCCSVSIKIYKPFLNALFLRQSSKKVLELVDLPLLLLLTSSAAVSFLLNLLLFVQNFIFLAMSLKLASFTKGSSGGLTKLK